MARRYTCVVTALALKNDGTWIFRITAQIDKRRERDRNMQDMVCNCLLCSGMYHFAGALCFWMEQFFLNERTEAWINFFWSVFAQSVIHLKNLRHSTSIFFLHQLSSLMNLRIFMRGFHKIHPWDKQDVSALCSNNRYASRIHGPHKTLARACMLKMLNYKIAP